MDSPPPLDLARVAPFLDVEGTPRAAAVGLADRRDGGGCAGA
ncbi:MAG TPA: hypothetical protein VFZ01_00475 [Geminicoccaceae bacterium]